MADVAKTWTRTNAKFNTHIVEFFRTSIYLKCNQ